MYAMKVMMRITKAFENTPDGSKAELDTEPSKAEHFFKALVVCTLFRHDHKKTRQCDDDCRADFWGIFLSSS